jgi:hypothetical protein
MSSFWYQDPWRVRHPRTVDEATIWCDGVYKKCPKGVFVNPIRACYLPHNHWALKHIDETKYVFCETPVGFGLMEIKDLEWKR